ncbi:hypothetical protein [Crucian carp herpesvirus]|uniref:ORF111 n=1 Tax=Cyprinid herpesvirus 2 TaxID=317878 RepID=K7PCD7_CYHV2|nr:protein ORF111 [Cyprinid herpesvirus 2]APB92955.1 hypothetical protein [Crucian carp herpesvirus]AFJ20537.1 protein ORF111 [Cyprinid herpesvirus 2]AKC02054.1 hypothetical protein [Cyprinid herpesvirus 2]AMB21679.1 ORF111 [Cyprinid herpesvirus 2]QAU54832.1 protein ORF111 [Cyprinid herpesvirus 2]
MAWWTEGLANTWDGYLCDATVQCAYTNNPTDIQSSKTFGCKHLRQTSDPQWESETTRASRFMELMLALQRGVEYINSRSVSYMWPSGEHPTDVKPGDFWLSEDCVPQLAAEWPHVTLMTASGLRQPLFIEDRVDVKSAPCMCAVWVNFEADGTKTISTRRHNMETCNVERWGREGGEALVVWDPANLEAPARFDLCERAVPYRKYPMNAAPQGPRLDYDDMPVRKGCSRHFQALKAVQTMQKCPWWVEREVLRETDFAGANRALKNTFFFTPCDDLNLCVQVWYRADQDYGKRRLGKFERPAVKTEIWRTRRIPVLNMYSSSHGHCFFSCRLWGPYESDSSKALVAPTMKALLSAMVPIMVAGGCRPLEAPSRSGGPTKGVPKLKVLTHASCLRKFHGCLKEQHLSAYVQFLSAFEQLAITYDLPYHQPRPLRSVLDLPDKHDCTLYQASPPLD